MSDPTQFDRSMALRIGEAILAMYRGTLKPTINKASTDTQVRIEEAHDGELFVLLPGTDSLRDFRTDAKILKVDDGFGAKVHHGFDEAFLSVIDDVVRDVRGAKRIKCGGHSLGAAVVKRIARALARRGFYVEAVYTFGEPRVGNGAWARDYNRVLGARTFRIVNARDPVPWLPFPLQIPRTGIYTHTSRLVYLPHDGGIQIEPNLLQVAAHVKDAWEIIQDQRQEAKFFGDVLTARCHQQLFYNAQLKGLPA